MPTSSTSSDTQTKRVNLRLDQKLVNRVDSFSSQNSISRTKAIDELIQLGLDSELAGIESSLAIQQKLSRDLQSLRGLVAAAIDAADTSSALSLVLQLQSGQLKPEQVSDIFSKARKIAKTKIKQLKKEA